MRPRLLTWLKRHGTRRNREGMAQYAIPSDHAYGVSVADIRVLARRLGRNHELAAALWDTGGKDALRELTSAAVIRRLSARAGRVGH